MEKSNQKNVSIADFLRLRKELPLVDVRAPVEFESGHIPSAINVPLLRNDDRVEVGTTYKKLGREKAIEVGWKHVTPRIEDLIHQARTLANDNPLLVHCWRGGMRSRYFSDIIFSGGVSSFIVEGGYKAYRTFGLKAFEQSYSLLRLGGCTGSGKTDIIHALAQTEQTIDLEKMASHRGSAFGALRLPAQPTTEQFQNQLFEHLWLLEKNKISWVEDESISIGKIFLPTSFWNQLTQSSIIEIQVDKATRVQRILAEYGQADDVSFLACIDKLAKRLGGLQCQQAKSLWIENRKAECIELLLTYYDKMYQESLQKKNKKIVAVLSWDGKNVQPVVEELKSIRQKLTGSAS